MMKHLIGITLGAIVCSPTASPAFPLRRDVGPCNPFVFPSMGKHPRSNPDEVSELGTGEPRRAAAGQPDRSAERA
jgi:hypothetical protein